MMINSLLKKKSYKIISNTKATHFQTYLYHFHNFTMTRWIHKLTINRFFTSISEGCQEMALNFHESSLTITSWKENQIARKCKISMHSSTLEGPTIIWSTEKVQGKPCDRTLLSSRNAPHHNLKTLHFIDLMFL